MKAVEHLLLDAHRILPDTWEQVRDQYVKGVRNIIMGYSPTHDQYNAPVGVEAYNRIMKAFTVVRELEYQGSSGMLGDFAHAEASKLVREARKSLSKRGA